MLGLADAVAGYLEVLDTMKLYGGNKMQPQENVAQRLQRGLDGTTIGQGGLLADYNGLEVRVREVLNGYIVEVGCKTVVFTSKAELLKELSRFLDDKNAVAKEYLEKEGKPK